MKPNIFDIATKELSQDAFITWLLQFADAKYQSDNPKLNNCGKAFITQLIKKQFPAFDEQINTVEAGRQLENIDVWAEVNKKFLIIIEDKTYTTHHSNQLKRYKEFSEERCTGENYEPPICIYLKTGNESQNSLNDIQQQGFAIFSRIDLINLLDDFKDITNNIFTDFHERLIRLEKYNNEFENKPVEKWNGNDWQGFFQFLEKQIKGINWFYVNNPTGGFWCAVLNWERWGNYPVYIQLEEEKLCFKISTSSNDTGLTEDVQISTIRYQIHELIMKQANEFGYKHIRRPNRFGSGQYMTVAVVDRKNWLGEDNQTINRETVIKTLTDYMDFLKQIITEDQNKTA